MSSQNDELFLEILKREKNITNFLDAFFGFLFKCTDFYIESEPGQKLGFPPGVAENLVRMAFKKWQNQSSSSSVSNTIDPISSTAMDQSEEVPIAVQELEITEEPTFAETKIDEEKKNVTSSKSQLPECYNGAVRENYSWSQTISDLDVIVQVPSCVSSAKNIKVDILGESINVSVDTKCLMNSNVKDVEKIVSREKINPESRWTSILQGNFSCKIKKEESLWSFIPGQYVSIHLEKSVEKWWDSLLIDEPKIKLNEIDCSRDISELDDCEQMKVEELMWNQRQKMLGKPTSEQMKMEKMLKQAWDAEGSPFKGQPYDPSVVKFD